MWVVCCLVGLDEVQLADEHLLHKLVYRSLSDCLGDHLLLVCARPCPEVSLLFGGSCIDLHVVQSGFSRECRTQFFSMYGRLVYGERVWVDTMKPKLYPVLDHLEESNASEMTFLPFIATILVHSLSSIDVNHLPKSTAHLLCYLLSSLVQGGTPLKKKPNPPCPVFHSLECSTVKNLRLLASFAYQMTIEGRVVFSQSPFESALSEVCGGSYALKKVHDCLTFSFSDVSEAVQGNVEKRQFIHLSVHEVLTAYHVISLLLNDEFVAFEESMSRLLLETNFGSQFTMTLHFIASLVPVDHAIRFFQCITCHQKVNELNGEIVQSIVWHCYVDWFQSLIDYDVPGSLDQQTLKKVCVSLSSFFLGQLHILHVFNELSDVSFVVQFLKHTTGLLSDIDICGLVKGDQICSSVYTYHKEVKHLTLVGVRLINPVDVVRNLCSLISESTNLESFSFRSISWSSSHFRKICSTLSQNQTITHLDLDIPDPEQLDLSHEELPRYVQFLDNMKYLSCLRVECATPATFIAVLNTACVTTQLTNLSVEPDTREEFKPDQCAKLLRKVLQVNTKLQSLGCSAGSFSFTDTVDPSPLSPCMLDLCRAVRQHGALEQFEFECFLFHLSDSRLVDALCELVGETSCDDPKLSTGCLREIRVHLAIWNRPDGILRRKFVEAQLCHRDGCVIDIRVDPRHREAIEVHPGCCWSKKIKMWYEWRDCSVSTVSNPIV